MWQGVTSAGRRSSHGRFPLCVAQLTSKQKKRDSRSEARKALKEQVKLDPEVVFFEGPPHWSEVVVPAVSILTVIGTHMP